MGNTIIINNKKRGLLVGCNYPNTPHQLKGCYNDVQNVKKTLTSNGFGFDPDNITILTGETDQDGATAENIKNKLKSKVQEAEKGDMLFFYFSGQGVKTSTNEAAILASDQQIITSDDLKEIMNGLPQEVAPIIVLDSSYSGLFKNCEQVILLSGCGPDEKRHDMHDDTGNPCGAFTNAALRALKATPCFRTAEENPQTNKDVVVLMCKSSLENAGKILKDEGIDQNPCLICTPDK